ncbi:unnamed protein product [Owenia fusiformis]|uniref:Protein MON2 homolog n=1 Tax=Owenia fusiformis TaxID=6347 RepID=A0A8S4NV57_OWEFU|nr:unnamed protein product [Owenia fusiformis]
MTAHQNKQVIAKKLVENLLGDLRSLSAETKRKYPPVKEASEAGMLRLRSITAKTDNIIAGLVSQSTEVIQPFILGCDTKNPKIVHICLTSMQRLVQHESISMTAANNIISMLWVLMEAGIEELKLLQTATLLLTTNAVVQHESLAKAVVLCFRLHFTKDSTTNNTAAAVVRNLVSIVFERVVTEDAVPSQEPLPPMSVEQLKAGSRQPPQSLRPCAGDAYLLFQDFCQLVNADQPYWLVGMTEMTRTFGLELMESVLTTFPAVFLKHPEFSFLLKEKVCPLVIKLFSPSLKYRQGLPSLPSPVPVEKPYFPIVMRLLRIVNVLIHNYYKLLSTECEIFLSLLVKFLDGEKPMWQRCLALEVIQKLVIQPHLVRSFCESYDMKQHSTKIFRDIVNAVGALIQSLFMNPPQSPSGSSGNKTPDITGQPPAIVAGMPVGGGVTPQPAFLYRGVWIPLIMNVPRQTFKAVFIELLDKVDPPNIPDGYAITVAFSALLEVVSSVQKLIESSSKEKQLGQGLQEELINSSWCGVLAALSLMLDASTDESATEVILKSQQAYASLCGTLEMTTPRDAFITSLCKASLPPHYTLTVLNTHRVDSPGPTTKGHTRSPSQDVQPPVSAETMHGSQVVAVGTALPTASLPIGAQSGPVMLTAKNIQCMRAILSVTHCHGGILGSAWHLVLTTLQHLTWILGLKPSTGGSLKAGGQPSDGSNAVITTAVMADLPVLSSMLSRLFESSQYLDDVALHHLIDALCKLSTECMEMAYSNREPSLFAVAKLLETGLVNLFRVDVLWKPVTAHLLEVCQHPHQAMRGWGVEAITTLIKAALAHRYEPPLEENLKLQSMLLAPLQELSSLPHADIRQQQLECVLVILHNNGDTLGQGWPLILGVIGAVTNNQGENLIRSAFQSLQLVVTDYLPVMPCTCLQICVGVASKFGLQNQELNISLTSIGLLWNISDFFYQNRQKITVELNQKLTDQEKHKLGMPPFDNLWMCLFAKLGELCVDPRPAVRKSAGQTLFSTISAHGRLLQRATWQTVIWQVLFPLLDQVKKLSSKAPDTKDSSDTGNILIHHSRDTAQKQWAETRVLSLAGVARVFNTKRKVLQLLGDFPRAWALLLEFIENAALSRNAEISLAALKSFQEILHITKHSNDGGDFPGIPKMADSDVEPPSEEIMSREDDGLSPSSEENIAEKEESITDDITVWSTAWRVWLSIGTQATECPSATTPKDQIYVPTQAFLTALVQIYPALYEHIKTRFVAADLQKLSTVLQRALSAPVAGDASPFIVPVGAPEVSLTPLQDSVLSAVKTLHSDLIKGTESSKTMYPDLFGQLLTFIEYAVRPPKYGNIETKAVGSVRGMQSEWVSMNFVPFAEQVVGLVIELYKVSASNPAVIEQHVLYNIVKCASVNKYMAKQLTTLKWHDNNDGVGVKGN